MNPIKRVSVVSTGLVQIRPQHAESDGSPMPWWLFTSRRWTAPLPINAYVIEHERGLVLFDTGQDLRSVTDPDYFPRGFAGLIFKRLAKFGIAPEQTLTAQLAHLGYDIADVKVAVLSHLHQDHIGGLPELGSAEIVVSEAEWALIERRGAETNGFLVKHIDLPGLTWRRIASDDLDLFGDGSIVLLSTPGHTPGSISMLVRQAGHAAAVVRGRHHLRPRLAGEAPSSGRRRSAPSYWSPMTESSNCSAKTRDWSCSRRTIPLRRACLPQR